MSMPTGNDVQAIEPVLTNMLVAYFQSQNRFVADKVFPAVPVQKDSGTYYTFPKAYWFGDNAAARAYGAEFAMAGYGVSTGSYATVQYALAHAIADEVRANSQVPYDLETAAAQFLAMNHMIRRERAWATDFMTTGVWGTSASISNKWSDYTNGDPVGDIRTGVRTISQATGMLANTMVIGEIVRDRLINHPDIIDRMKYTTAAGVVGVESALGNILGVTPLVAAALYNTVNEAQTATLGAIVDDDALICYVSLTPGIFTASAGYTFTWAPGGGIGTVYAPYRAEGKKADVYNSNQQFDHAAVATDLGYFIADCVD